MRSFQALALSLCCLGMVGCATMGTSSRPIVPAPAGPDSFAAAPPPVSVPSSTITVAPSSKSYKAESDAPGAPARKAPPKSSPPQKTMKEEAPEAPQASAPASGASEGEDSLIAQPVRKGTGVRKPVKTTGVEKPATEPQSALKRSSEVVPVSSPAIERVVNSKLSS